MRRVKIVVLVVLLGAPGLGGACRQAGGAAPAARVVDSVRTRGEALARFRAGMTEPRALKGGAATRDELIQQFARGLERADTAALARLALSPAEFAWLYYPTAREALPPYSLPPGLMWFTLQERSRQGLLAALDAYGGRPFRYAGYVCPAAARGEGENVFWGWCRVRQKGAAGRLTELSLFGLVVERDGRFKFVSFANKL